MIEWESLGAGAATGFVTSILTLLGWNRRLTKLEDDKADIKELESIDGKVADLKEEYKYIRTRLDEIYSRLTK